MSQPKTRQELAGDLEKLEVFAWLQVTQDAIDAAAAELRKSCATCRYFGVRSLTEAADDAVQPHWCHESPREVSGGDFCSRWAR